ncbi:MAG: hypothetical protein A2Y33_10360 [Spirochaetes bacterium GWF1_51_8]|nr:MAG: hypothetical protein A2Y33_10360 [Spirochaetes bacterium GWF1_51_8]
MENVYSKTIKTKNFIVRSAILLQSIGFGLIIALIWMNEVFDLPHYLFGAPKTPINYTESIFETCVIMAITAVSIFFTVIFIRRIRYLEGFLPVCSFCKKIRINDRWIPIDDYLMKHSETILSHSLCPDCAIEHYPQYMDDTKP